MKDKSGYQIRKENHICVNCGGKAAEGHVRCDACRLLENEKQRARVAAKRVAKVCLDCGAPIKRGLRCVECRKNIKLRRREKYKYCHDYGLCANCGDPNGNGKVFCDRCAEITNAKARERYKNMSPEQKAKKIAYAKAYQKAHPDKKKEAEKRFREREKTRYEY